MGEILTYRQISFDTAHIAPGRLVSTTFFEAMRYPALDGSTRVTELDEKPLIRCLMLGPQARQIIFEELGLTGSAFYCPEVVQPFDAPGEGDLDLIVCPVLTPARVTRSNASARRSKPSMRATTVSTSCRTWLTAFAKRTGSITGHFAFHQTYLGILTEVIGSGQEEINIPNRGVRSHTSPQCGATGRTTFRQSSNSLDATRCIRKSAFFSLKSCNRRASRSIGRQPCGSAFIDGPPSAISATPLPIVSARSWIELSYTDLER